MAARLEITVSFALAATLLCCILGHCEMSVYPGLRRRPIQAPVMDPQSEQEYAFLAQMMEQYARRRLQQQFDQQLHEINLKMDRQRELLERERYRQRQQELAVRREQEEDYEANEGNNLEQQYDQYDNAEAEASYGSPLEAVPDVQQPPSLYLPRLPNLPPLPSLPKSSPGRNSVLRDRIPFAVGPNDARFFDNPNDPSGELDSRALEDYEEYAPIEPTLEVATAPSKTKIETPVAAPVPVEPPKLLDVASANFHRINPQSVAAAAVAGVNLPQGKDQSPQELNALINKLQKQSKSPHLTLVNDGVANQEQIVLRQHLGMNSEMGVYIVALIAGVSAAVTVGLLALGVTWFHNRHKAAADVEYPAYGVTGPNKDVSPSGDRKLAQSAQMYHYQHQKQQIIAMENCQATDGSCSLSDVESDDDNEEGDYTVYECPGLAPTGEMEVKNPLFLDETPATPANNLSTAGAAGAGAGATNNNITQATPQQPATQKKGTVKPNMNLLNAAATAAAAAAASASAGGTGAAGGEEPKQKRKSKK
ncbi:uncharacterized protein LOC110184109 isoform X1 [Drosophila serrata]|uniref:uncharacterized protein LOC110184109 isoform X1 n=2 Tax=Drosophila serrata TaxID=7274 RepID=UPI000A1D028F|nr:uncharacterized protein LOC110184109 isoform X1 [Drosophila serrata]